MIVETYDATQERWVTMKGTHVEISDKSGNILKGPSNLKTSLNKKNKAKKMREYRAKKKQMKLADQS